ncbi:MAG: histidine ammonia-lyase [Alphaproteobacteria bacterium]
MTGDPILQLEPGALTLRDMRRIARAPVRIELAAKHMRAAEAAADAVRRVLAEGRTVYGINTGFGSLAQTRIGPDQLGDLQTNLVLSHCAGTGPLLDDAAVRLAMALKINSLALGHSGLQPAIILGLARLLDAGVYPCIPAKGSVGASGDLAPLAHMSAPLLGHGEVRVRGEVMPAKDGLAVAGLEPIALGPKDGLSLLNGTQVSTALALTGLFAIEDVFAAAVVAGAMSVDAVKGSDVPFEARIQKVRGHKGQSDVAAVLGRLIAGSDIRRSHIDCDRVQDPYSLRCQPQVMGACLETMRFVAATLETEANGVSDNPLVFAEEDEILSGGNFHAEPVAMAADALAIAVAEIANLSERRIAVLVDEAMNGGLPHFLVEEGGVNSGFMIAQVAAAALVSQNKMLAHPASVDSIPTSANQEDHVSMATHAAWRLGEMADNARGVVATELLAAAQGLDFHAPMKTSESLQRAHAGIRERVAHLDRDRAFAPDIEAMKEMIATGEFVPELAAILPSTS